MRWTTGGLFAVLFLIATIRSAPVQRADGDDEDDPSRLPKSSEPIRYDIALTTNVHTGDRAFTGTVSIEIEITADTNTITLHNNGLTAISTRLHGNGFDDISHTTSSDTSRNFFFITTETTLRVEELYIIEITYSGQLQTSMNGFYLSSYRIGTETRYLASTQFQSTGARYSFFCYDEPEFKAEFKLAITHATVYSAISNTIGTKSDLGNGTSTTSFPATPVMSSYLLAFVVSDFDYSSNEDGLVTGETVQRVYARPDEKQRTQYALESSVKFLKQLEAWANYKYELPKMFSAAIPDFAAGAMENWGLITYKEQYLILEESSHPREKFDSLRVIAHELGHQFFGNVVTCKWWNYIWLNEGYATVFEYLLVDREYPDLRMNELFSVIKVQGAFRPDSLESTHPMTFNGQTQSLIIYDKAGSVIRMFQYALGDSLFARAMQYYLEENHHRPVTSDDLYAAVEVVLAESNFVDFDFTRAFKTWENQKGYPLVHVTADYSLGQFIVTQKRYLAFTDKNETDNSRWYIPLNYAVESAPQLDDTKITDYFSDDQIEKRISYPPSFTLGQWFIFNKQQIGYYRVNYDEDNWQQLIRTLNSDNFKDIHVSNRAQLVDDALNLAADEYLDYNIAFGILSYLERETDYIPWRAVITNLDKLDYLVATDSGLAKNFQRFVRKLGRFMYITYGLEERPDDSMVDQFARELAIDWTCRMGDERCLRDTYAYLRQIALEGLVVPKSLQITYMCNGLRAPGRQDEFNALWNRMLESNDQSERIRIIDGLVCSSDSTNLHNLLRATIDTDAQTTYRAHEITRIWSNILTKSWIGIDAMIDFIDERYDEIWTSSSSRAASTINALSQRISSSADQVKLTNLMNKLVARPTNPLSANTRTSALNNIQVNTEWIASEKFARATTFINEVIGAIDDEQNQLILPKTSEPRHYNIHITATNIPNGGREFSGEIEIDALVKVTTDRIIIHSREQTVLDVQAFNKNDLTPITVYDFSRYEASHTLTIYFLSAIPADSEIILRIKYEGIMQTAATNYGFHIASYVHEGQTRYMGVTQFESSLGSRFAFPHYDEPRYKATFTLKLTHSDSHHAISNTFGTPVVNEGEGTITTTFEETPRMSSYLLAFIISDLASVTNADTIQEGETLHRIWVRPDSTSKALFALESADSGLKALESYLNFDFELPKMDSAGVPGKNGAMENWGMITYWESSMIYQEEYEDITHALKFSGVNVILHETAHQFFGNAATFEWWDYLWLSEGFATLLSYQVTEDLHSDWRQRHFFNIRELQNAFRADSSNNTRSMTPTPSLVTPAQIRSTFDTIAYDKSGSVIRMFQNAVGEDIFRAALTRYLNDNIYQSVIPQNLYDAFQATMNEASFGDFDFAVAFRTWEQQRGYPIIHCSYSNGQFEIRQERYFTQKPAASDDTSNWYIPINFATASDPNFEDTRITNYFNNGLSTTTIPVPASFDSSQWFIFNKQQLGYYRVNYDAENWHAITLALNSRDYDEIHVLNRVQLIDDAVNFANGDYITYDVLFGLLQYLSRETEYTPWYSADRFISLLYTAFGPFNADLNSFVRHLSKRMYSSYKLESTGVIPFEEVYVRYGRDIATRIACNAGNEGCLEDTANVLRGFIESDRKIPKGLESAVLCNSFKTANSVEWSTMWNEMQTTSDTTFRSQILSGLGCSRNSTLLKSYLESTIGTAITYTQGERRNVLSSVLNSNVGLQVVINFMSDFRSEIMSYYSYTLEEMITVPARTIKTSEQQTLFNSFLQTLTDLGEEAAGRVNTIVNNIFGVQQGSFYPEVMAMIKLASENQLRLPKTSEPRHYKLHLDARNIPSGNRAFTGEIEIQTVITEPTDRIMIHSKTQVIDDLRVLRGANELELIEYHLYPETDTLTIYFVNYLATNDELNVQIKYSTELVQGSTGFYQTSYSINNEQRYLGATQFESTGGRYCFPHYDEPGFKATFDLSITHDTGHTAIANTFGTRVENEDRTATTTFSTSPVMSSYLLAFVVSDLEYVDNEESREPGETLHRVWVRPDSLEKAWYAVNASDLVLKALEEYTGFDYELPKVDSAGVPNKGGAMENWGMVTYRENAMIYEVNYEDISHTQKWSGVEVIAHELAHQFFGDSVTCEWWDTIWLNEGFATVFEYHLVGMIYPEWRVKDMFNLRTLQNVMRNDAREVTRAMTKPLLTPAEISGAFDYVVYDKAGSVLRMFQYALGEDIFRAALKLYLNTNNHKAINSQPLVDAFKTEMVQQGLNDFDFDLAFRSWELQRGYPVIHVSYLAEGQFLITQQRFFTQSNQSVGDTSSWYIPLNFATSSDPNFDDTTITNYFVNGNDQYLIDAPSQFDPSQWFVFNKQQLGYYRVNYDLQNWNALSVVLNSENFNQIHVLNRAQLIDDAVNFANGDYITYDVLFGLLQYLSREAEYAPWYSADRFISLLYTAFGPFNADLNSFVRHLSKRMYSSYKLESTGVIPFEEVYVRYGRDIATRIACNAGNEECLEDTANVLRGFIESDRKIPKGLESAVLCNSFKTANSVEWSIMLSEMRTTSDTTFRSQILSGLGCTRNSTLLQSYLESTVDSENTYTQAERRSILSSVLNSNVGLQAVINFIRVFRLDIMSYYSYTLEEMITVPARTIKTSEQQTLFNSFLQTLTDLGEEAAGRVNTIVNNIFEVQQGSFYPEVMAMIQLASENQLRLPKTSEPRHYKLHLDARNIPSGNRAFTGEIEIQTVITEPTDRIMIHSKTQVIDDLRVLRGANELELIEYHLYPETDTLTIYFVNYLATNDELNVQIKYSTELVRGSTGFYQTSYSINNEQRYLGATQFESTGGRYCFPHYDEPGFKATFDLSITHDTGHTAIANTFGTRVENEDRTATSTFSTSPVMSSYLLAFVVSDLEYVDNEESREPGETLHRVWVRPDSLEKAWYAVNASDLVLKALEEYTGFDYELPKVDSAGVPNKGGAMENWGMVTYRENAMIYEVNYEDISHTQKWSGVGVIAHELAHQFFGDSVTCEWWDTIWLNEGFATVFEYHLVGMIYPEWRVKDMFNLRTLQNVMRNDAREVTRAMTKPLLTPAEISGAFDYVVYAKSGSVLRMFQYALGEDIFRAALKLYLNTNNHKAINSQPLVDAFKTEMVQQGLNDFDFDLAFRSWELQRGYPVIHVSYLAEGQFQITQQRFFTQSNQSVGDTSSWYIPLNFATSSDPNFDDTTITNYFVNGNDQYLIDAPSQFDPSQWFVFNKQQLGYYRVNYDLQNWNALSVVLNSENFNQIHVLNRAQLIDDALSFAQGNYLEYDVLLELLPYLQRETDYPGWYAADRFISALYSAFGPFNVELNQFVRTLSERFYDVFKLPDDGRIPFEELFERYTRELALKLACNAGNERCLADTFNVIRLSSVPKGLETVVLCSGLRGTGKQTQWTELYQIMQTTTDATFKNQLLNGLACTNDADSLKIYLESTVAEGNSYTESDRRALLNAVLNSQSGLVAVINFIKDFESDLLQYTSLEDLLRIPAAAIKGEDQRTVFVSYLATFTNLDEATYSRITAIVDNNFAAQQQYATSMAFIRQFLSSVPTDPTSAPTDPTSAPTDPTSAPTDPTSAPTDPTSPPTEPTEPETTTPSGAESIDVKIATIFASLLIAFAYKI